MRGIVGYAGAQSALDVVLAGLEALEAREAPKEPEEPGYDAAGVAVLADGGLAAAKTVGELDDLRRLLARRPLPAAGSAVGHLRRAVHGAPEDGGRTDGHAPPHLDNAGRVALVHDGGIGNHAALRAEPAGRGHALVSGTGTEVAAHLLAEAFSSCGEAAEAMRQVCRVLEGTFALLALHADEPDTVIAARRGLPLAVGLGDGEGWLASHPAAFAGWEAGEVVELGADHPGEVVLLRRDADELRCEITDPDGGVVRA